MASHAARAVYSSEAVKRSATARRRSEGMSSTSLSERRRRSTRWLETSMPTTSTPASAKAAAESWQAHVAEPDDSDLLYRESPALGEADSGRGAAWCAACDDLPRRITGFRSHHPIREEGEDPTDRELRARWRLGAGQEVHGDLELGGDQRPGHGRVAQTDERDAPGAVLPEGALERRQRACERRGGALPGCRGRREERCLRARRREGAGEIAGSFELGLVVDDGNSHACKVANSREIRSLRVLCSRATENGPMCEPWARSAS